MSLLSSRLFQTGLRNISHLRNTPTSRTLSSWTVHACQQQQQQQQQQQKSSTNNYQNKSKSKFLFYASSAATAFAITSTLPMTRSTVYAEFSTIATSPPAGTTQPQAAQQQNQATTSNSENKVSGEKTPEITLYQFEVCPFCNKVRAYLDYHNIPYRVVEVDPLRKTELKQFSDDYRKVPIAVINSKQINGSASVISSVQSMISSSESDSPISKVEQQWLTWLDDHLIHLIAPNIYRSPSESLQTFNYITDKSKFSSWDRFTIRYTGAAAMYMIGKKLKKKYNIQSERDEMHQAIDTWMKAIQKGGSDFLDGKSSPGVADLSVFGVLKAIQTFDTFTEIKAQNEEFAKWFDTMTAVVGESSKTVDE